MTIHAANIGKSERLKRVKKFLNDKRPHSGLEIAKKCHVYAISTIMCELRANGVDIETTRKADRYYYRIV